MKILVGNGPRGCEQKNLELVSENDLFMFNITMLMLVIITQMLIINILMVILLL